MRRCDSSQAGVLPKLKLLINIVIVWHHNKQHQINHLKCNFHSELIELMKITFRTHFCRAHFGCLSRWMHTGNSKIILIWWFLFKFTVQQSGRKFQSIRLLNLNDIYRLIYISYVAEKQLATLAEWFCHTMLCVCLFFSTNNICISTNIWWLHALIAILENIVAMFIYDVNPINYDIISVRTVNISNMYDTALCRTNFQRVCVASILKEIVANPANKTKNPPHHMMCVIFTCIHIGQAWSIVSILIGLSNWMCAPLQISNYNVQCVLPYSTLICGNESRDCVLIHMQSIRTAFVRIECYILR